VSSKISTQAVNHVTLTVSDVPRSTEFYSGLFNFDKIADFGPRILLGNGSFILVLTPPADPDQAISDDTFNENRIGLDHVSFSVASMADLEAAAKLLDENGISHGEIKPLTPFGIAVMAIRDPDNIQIELTAPLG
jgi:catechol 2,3-dioxygenase-like lactoylglutathione lyase family enzyme